MNKVFIVGRIDGNGSWDFQGVFETEQLAIAACRDETYFIGPAIVNEVLGHDTEDWPGAYSPKAVKQ